MEHTKGPWTVRDGQEILDWTGDECRLVARCHAGHAPERAANARIIASAPALLEALRELAEIGEGGVIERRETGKPIWSALDAIKTIARAAIAKAQGGSIS